MRATVYERTYFIFRIMATSIQIIVNFSMMVMMFKHPRNTNQHESVLVVKKDLVYLVNKSNRSSMMITDAGELNWTFDQRKSQERYSKHIDDMVDNQMLSIIGAIMTLG